MKTRYGLLVLIAAVVSALTIVVVGCDKAPVTTVGTEIDDSVITSSVKSTLLAAPNINSFDFKVETHKGEVMLSGFVDNQTQLDTATSLIRAVPGVQGIRNNVGLKGTATSVGNKVDDGIVTAKVKAALLGDAHVKSLAIAVVTRHGEVQLSGFVDNPGQIDRALQVARSIDGANRVSNEMSVKK